MPAGLGGGGRLAVVFETTMGTFLPPSTAGVKWVPILEENLEYNEDKYYSPQIRQETIVSDVQPSFYHVEGDITMEVDTAFLPYFLYASRFTPVKTGASSPFTYKFTPSSAGSASTASGPTTRKTLSITVIRNEIGFGYAGCVVTGGSFTVEDGVLKCTFNILGLSEGTPGGLGTPAWVAPKLMGADTGSIYSDASSATPGFANPAETNFNGFTFNFGFNGEAQNRIRSDRAASYISFGESEANIETELDFESKTEYDNFKAATQKAFRYRAIGDAAAYAASTDAVTIDVNRGVYDAYGVALPGMADLIMADTNIRSIGIAGGSAYSIEVKSTADIL